MNYLALHRGLARMPGHTLRCASLYGLAHAVVDASSAIAVLRAGGDLGLHLDPFTLIVLYDVLAFGLQAPLGALFDRRRQYRVAIALGVALTFLALVFARLSPFASAILVGFGNALFHVGAGALVLRESQGRASDAGVFVAPGAIGLAVGMHIGMLRKPLWWPFAVALMLIFVVVAANGRAVAHSVEEQRQAPFDLRLSLQSATSAVFGLLLLLLLGSVFVRSFVGFGACYQCPRVALLVVGAPAMAFLGKFLGGFLADRVGWLVTGVGVLIASAPLIAFNGGSVGLALLGIMLFQMTMPVTLAAIYRMLPARPGLAFGLPCVALLLGALPTYYPAGKHLYSSALFLILILASALALCVALVRLGAKSAPTNALSLAQNS